MYASRLPGAMERRRKELGLSLPRFPLRDRRRGPQWAREITPACGRTRSGAAARKHAAATTRLRNGGEMGAAPVSQQKGSVLGGLTPFASKRGLPPFLISGS